MTVEHTDWSKRSGAQLAAEAGSFEWTPASGDVRWCATTARILGIRADDRVGSLEDLFEKAFDADARRAFESLTAVGAGDTARLARIRIKHSDNSVGFVVLAVAGTGIDDETLRVVATVHDRTHEEAVRLRRQRADERFREAQRIASFGCWQWDAPTGGLEWSEEVYRMCGVARDARIDLAFYHALVHEDDREHVVAQCERALETGQSEPLVYRVVRQNDGEIRHVQSLARPHWDANGEVQGFVGTLLDVTERAELQEQLLHSQKLEAIGRLAGGVAHDFNNVLTSILGNTNLLKQIVDSESRVFVDAIGTSAERAAELTRHLLVFARKHEAQARVIDARSQLLAVDRMLRPLLGERIRLVTCAAEDCVAVCIDPGHLEQVLVNLAVNARHAMPDGGELRIDARNSTVDDMLSAPSGLQLGEYLEISISDTGHGMSEEVRQQIFEPFFTTKGDGEGTGLGLSTCHGIVTQNGGAIAVRSKPGEGATFTLWFPAADRDRVSSLPLEDSFAAHGGSETVLLVEDDDLVREMAAETLRRLGYFVLDASAGGDAIGAMTRFDGYIDLVLSDVVLPDISGPEIAAEVRKSHPGAKVLFASGYSDDELRREGMAPDSHVLSKPFTSARLARLVREVLDETSPSGPSPISN